MSEKKDLVAVLRRWMEAFTTRSMHEWALYVRSIGLSMPKAGILMFLYHKEGCGVHEIGERMEISSAAASQIIDRLVNDGLLERAESAEDRRVRRISLTKKGKGLMEKGMRERHRWADDLVAALSTEEREAVSAALPILLASEKKLNILEGRSSRPRNPREYRGARSV
jgi:DNA-binding MarR family transcriptional regulator